MRIRQINEEAVSEVVGEMLMIALVLILVAIFSASMGNYLPHERDPSVTIMATANDSHIVLWHKGGGLGTLNGLHGDRHKRQHPGELHHGKRVHGDHPSLR
ncbi:type IV pilin N-terminal domain-containing protein [Methanogenium cariaci]|uniref:type IV pilin N-terminal domain-containing protein n=1 Tax=Methanogenium cariaci TaxID=2197 RepID=UPI0007809079|nr:type IV pilin N-terminal domain-containing protein [Methanogenium cariaci]